MNKLIDNKNKNESIIQLILIANDLIYYLKKNV